MERKKTDLPNLFKNMQIQGKFDIRLPDRNRQGNLSTESVNREGVRLKILCFRPGPFIDIETGKVVGEHNGVHLWTIGQRIRLGKKGPQLGDRHNERG